jgi:hypothetical protein
MGKKNLNAVRVVGAVVLLLAIVSFGFGAVYVFGLGKALFSTSTANGKSIPASDER